MMGSEVAPAKVNLCLHVVGRRPDGYHMIDSVACFPGAADRLTAAPAEGLSLTISGRFGFSLKADPDNLVLRAARALGARLGRAPAAALHLEKNLPVASGVGGGSADAAAALRLLATLWNADAETRAALPALALELGADVPVCLGGTTARMRGVGESLDPVRLPSHGLLLVNPGLAVATAAVFQRLRQAALPWSPPLSMPDLPDAAALAAWLRTTRNDLQTPALTLCPPIGDVLARIAATPNCLLARMSGSGATCFGLYATAEQARTAAGFFGDTDWWVWPER
jgi:4-diphosphocytidyl-2-C-methyl-D-erythritol kinase